MLNKSSQVLKYHENKGFTLIELMIAISILTLLLFIGSYSYSLMSERWNKELGQFSQSSKIAKNIELLQRLLEGTQPYVVVDKNKKPSFFFIGGVDSLLAVSRSGLFSGKFSEESSEQFPEIFRLTTLEKENDKVDFVYQSVSTKSILLLGTEQEVNFDKQIVLFSNLDSVQFNYFGWDHLYEKNSMDTRKNKAQWSNSYSGINNLLMPEKYTITLIKLGLELTIPITLEEKPERWLAPYFEVNQ